FIVPRLRDEFVDRAFLYRTHDGGYIRMTGQHYPYSLRPTLPDGLEQLCAAHAGHTVIGKDQIDRLTFHDRERLCRGIHRDEHVILIAENPAHRREHPLFIIDEKKRELAVALPLRHTGKLLLFTFSGGTEKFGVS